MPSPNPRRSGNPARRATAGGSSAARPGSASGNRDPRRNQRSKALLERLSRLPPLAIPGAVLVLMLVGLSAPLAIAVPALALVVLFVGWLAYLSWPVLTVRAKLLRALMIGLVTGSVVARVLGWL